MIVTSLPFPSLPFSHRQESIQLPLDHIGRSQTENGDVLAKMYLEHLQSSQATGSVLYSASMHESSVNSGRPSHVEKVY